MNDIRRASVLAVLLAFAGPSSGLAAPPAPAPQASSPQAATALDAADARTAADLSYQFAATRVDSAPQIDGILDEEVWSRAVTISGFVQAQPDEGRPVSERTEVRVVYDAEAIYIAAYCYDSEPDRIIANVLRRDESNSNNDAFMVALDTYHDHRNGYVFETNPMGARYDAQIVGEGGSGAGRFSNQTLNVDWNAVWQARARVVDDGWVVEMAIPLWELRFAPDQTAWGDQLPTHHPPQDRTGLLGAGAAAVQ